MTFDTLQLSRTLQRDGDFSSKQAEAIASVFGESQTGLVTNGDLKLAISDVEKKTIGLDGKISEVEGRLHNRMATLLGLQTLTIIVALVGAVYTLFHLVAH